MRELIIGDVGAIRVLLDPPDRTDGTTPSVSLSAAPNPVAEGSPVTVTAALSAALQADVYIPLTLTAGPGTDEGDFGTLAGITVAAGETTGAVTVTTTADADTRDETFTVSLGGLPPSVSSGSPSSVVVTITDGTTPLPTALTLSAAPAPAEGGCGGDGDGGAGRAGA